MCDESKRALQYAMVLLGRRDYGTQELRERLAQGSGVRKQGSGDAFSEEDIEKALQRLTELGLLDDQKRAERLTDSYIRKGWGLRKIQMELRRRGLPAAEATADESEAIARLLQTKYAAKLGDEKARGLVVQALLRRGFSYAEIRDAMKLSDDENLGGFDDAEILD